MADSKLANPVVDHARPDPLKPRFNNGKKRLTGRFEHSAREPDRGAKEISRSGASGTSRAVKDKLSGAAETHSSFNKIERNRKGRRSVALRLSEVQNIMAAAVFTAEEHRALNRHTTIHFEAAGISDPVNALRTYMKLARDWLRTRGAPFAYVWVRESGELKGEHAHILMHVPADLVLQFARRERGWRKRIGARPRLGAFHSTPVGRSYRHADVGIQFGERYEDELSGAVAYLVKGADRLTVKELGLTKVEAGGELWGKRSCTSENIGRAARHRTPVK